jgi:hypothetical protein
VKPQSYNGINKAQPIVVNNNVLYSCNRGSHIREMGYADTSAGYVSGDLSLRAPHLFDNFSIMQMAYSKSPYPIAWMVRDDGQLIGLTYIPEQQIAAWHQHETDGEFESVCCIPEGNDDVLYLVVKRVIGGNTVRYVERMGGRWFETQADEYFVDCGLSYDGSPADEITGLNHLEGKTVSILADGAVHPRAVVTGRKVTLVAEASKVQVGLPYNADAVTLPLAVEIQGYGQGRQKNVNHVYMRVYTSSGVFAGPSVDDLVEAKQRTVEPYGTPPELKTEEIDIAVSPSWGDSGQVVIRQSDPLPITIMSMSLEVSVGG